MVKRELYLKRIRPFYESEMIKVITGIRRCGKSTLLIQIMEELSQQGVAKEQIIYINFEDYKFRSISTADELYEYVEQKIVNQDKYYLFIDEIQNVNDFELVVNSFRATHNISIFITGSNSKLLSGELATHLIGRTLSFRIMPFRFQEYCVLKGESASKEQLFSEYITWGGFPLVCAARDEESKAVILSNLYDSVVLKDIIMRNHIASPQMLEKILEYVIANTSATVSGNNIANVLSDKNQKVSSPTIYDYLRYMTDACICDKIPRYDIRGKRVLAFEEKMYVCDLGLFHLKKSRIKSEYSRIIETLIYNELIARGYQVFIGKTFKGEVDFIAEKQGKKVYIQAAYMLTDETTAEREFGAYDCIRDHYPKYVISMDPISLSRNGITHLNLINFLLDENSI